MAQLERRTGWAADVAAGVPVLMRSAVFGSRVVSYDGATAKVEVWMASVVGTARSGPVAEAWGTTAMELRWAQGRGGLVVGVPARRSGADPGLAPPPPPPPPVARGAARPPRGGGPPPASAD